VLELRSGEEGRLEPRLQAVLACIPVRQPGWEPHLAQGLLRILQRPTLGAVCFRHVNAFAASRLTGLRQFRTDPRQPSLSGESERHALAKTFIQLGWHFATLKPVQRTLAWLLLELHLRGDSGKTIAALASKLRGSINASASNHLLDTLGGCDGLHALLARMRWLRVQQTALAGLTPAGDRYTGNGSFDKLWSGTLAASCELLLSMPELGSRGSDAEDEGYPETRLGEAFLPMADAAQGDEHDDPPFCWIEVGKDEVPQRPFSASVQAQWGRELYRRSSPQLFRDPDNIAPAVVLKSLWVEQTEAGVLALRANELEKAEAHLLVLLAIEAGLSDTEARSLVWARGDKESGVVPRLDLRARALLRFEQRPPNAFEPKRDSTFWLPTGGFIAFPLSRPLLQIAVRLRRLKSRARRREETALQNSSPLLVQTDDARPVSAAMSSTAARPGLSAGALRLRLAAFITSRLGPDAAQIALGDSFGLGLAPTYYAAFSAEALRRPIEEYLDSVTGNPPFPSLRPSEAQPHVGSRVRPAGRPLALAWQALSVQLSRGRGRPSTRNFPEMMRRRRDALAFHLMLCTGHRPTRALAEVRLSDFVAEHALVVLGDKQADPSHATRVASTGWTFIGALESYVNELHRATRDSALSHLASGARRILEGERPLFEVPDARGQWVGLDVKALLGQLPEPWAARPNLHRHVLCQWLSAKGIHHELRSFQLGWMTQELHATSGASPSSPVELTRELAPFIDAWLSESGWLGGGKPRGSMPHRLGRKLKDFGARAGSHTAEFERSMRELRDGLAERGREVLPVVQQRLKTEVDRRWPGFLLRVRNGRARLERSKVTMKDANLVSRAARTEELLQVFASGLEQQVARRELVRILGKASRRGLWKGEVPKLPMLALNLLPSPFIRGLGEAVLHVDRLREGLPKVAVCRGDPGEASSWRLLVAASVWAIAAHSPHRDLRHARAIAAASLGAVRSTRKDWHLRVPDGRGHVVLSGVPAILLARIIGSEAGRKALKDGVGLDDPSLASVLDELLPEETTGLKDSERLDRMQAALLQAGEVELEGSARLVLRGAVRPVTVDAVRAGSALDGITVDRSSLLESTSGDTRAGSDRKGTRAELPRRRWHPRLREMLEPFNPDFSGKINGSEAFPAKKRGPQLRPALEATLSRMDDRPTLSFHVLSYAFSLLKTDGSNSAGGLAVSTVYKICNRISRALKHLDEDRSLSELDSREWTSVLMPYCLEADAGDRAEVLKEVRRFFAFMQDTASIESPDWGLLFASIGSCAPPEDPALLTDEELERVLSKLSEDACPEDQELPLHEAALRELRLAAALILEASGIRPGSAEGLTLADVHLHSDRDFVELRSRGRFASIKTRTSAGFVPLEGRHWAMYRPWFVAWFEALKRQAGSDQLAEVPLFQIPREPVGTRFSLADVRERITDLLRWATKDQTARLYHFRKRRIQLRHSEVRQSLGSRAADVARALRASGHASISTAITSYLAEPLCYLAEPRRLGREPPPESAAALSGLSVREVVQRWKLSDRKLAGHDEAAQRKRLDALISLPSCEWNPAVIGMPSPLKPPKSELGWDAVSWALELFAVGERDEDRSPIRWMKTAHWRGIVASARRLSLILRLEFAPGFHGLHPPRETEFSRRVFGLLEAGDPRLPTVAREWTQLARDWPGGDALPIEAPAAAEALGDLAQELGLNVRIEERPGRALLYRLVRPGSESDYGVWPALRWALAVAWVADSLSRLSRSD
jgi:hypothetical protein